MGPRRVRGRLARERRRGLVPLVAGVVPVSLLPMIFASAALVIAVGHIAWAYLKGHL